MAVPRAPNCGIFDPLYAISLVSHGWSPDSLLSLVIHLEKKLVKLQSGITLPLPSVLPLHLRLPC